MDPAIVKTMLTPAMQYGFAGFCFLLLGLVFWMIKDNRKAQKEQSETLLNVIENNTKVISINTMTIGNLMKQSNDELVLLRDMRESLMKRPCLLKERD